MTPQSREVLVQTGKAEKISVGFVWRHPPPKDHPTRARHGGQVAVPGGLGRVTCQCAVEAMSPDELPKICDECHHGADTDRPAVCAASKRYKGSR